MQRKPSRGCRKGSRTAVRDRGVSRPGAAHADSAARVADSDSDLTDAAEAPDTERASVEEHSQQAATGSPERVRRKAMSSKILYILGQLSDDDADWLGRVGRRLRLEAGDVLIPRGIHLEQLYIVLDGEFDILSPQRDEIARVGRGDILGELSLVDENPTSAEVIARSVALVLSVDSTRLAERMNADTAFTTRFYKAISMLLALRMRTTLSRFGAGDMPGSAIELAAADGATSLAEMHEIAAVRFERMLRRLWGRRDQ